MIEQTWGKIRLDEHAVFIGAVYLPPGSQQTAYMQVYNTAKDVLETANASDVILIFGDFNCLVLWMSDTESPHLLRVVDASASEMEFFDNLSSLGLSQICDVRQRNQLDLIFTVPYFIFRATNSLKRDYYHHAAIECSLKLQVPVFHDDEETMRYDFYNADLPRLCTALSRIDWSRVYWY